MGSGGSGSAGGGGPGVGGGSYAGGEGWGGTMGGGSAYGGGNLGGLGTAGTMSGGAGGAGMSGYGGGGQAGLVGSGWGGPGGSAGRNANFGSGGPARPGTAGPGYGGPAPPGYRKVTEYRKGEPYSYYAAVPTQTNALTIKPGAVNQPAYMGQIVGTRDRNAVPGFGPQITGGMGGGFAPGVGRDPAIGYRGMGFGGYSGGQTSRPGQAPGGLDAGPGGPLGYGGTRRM